MPQPLTYRPIKPADCAAVVQLHHSAFDRRDIEASIFVSRQVDHYLAQLVAFPDLQRENWLWGAFAGQELVGYIFGRALATSWHLNYLAVAAPHRGHGIGQELWGMWYKAGGECEYHSFTVDVAEHNQPAREWYERMGYCSIDTTYIYREELSDLPEKLTQDYQLLQWDNAQAWQAQYGFSQFELKAGSETWSVGRLGEKYFRTHRLPAPELRALLYQLDASRQLLLLSPNPISTMQEIKISHRLRCDLKS